MASVLSTVKQAAAGKFKRAYWLCGDPLYRDWLCSILEASFSEVRHVTSRQAWDELFFVGDSRPRLVVIHHAEALVGQNFTKRMEAWLKDDHLRHVHAVFLDALADWPKSLRERPSEARELWVGSGYPQTVYVPANPSLTSDTGMQQFLSLAAGAGAGSEPYASSLLEACGQDVHQTLNAATKVGWFYRTGASPQRAAMKFFGALPQPSYAKSLAFLDKAAALEAAVHADPEVEFPALSSLVSTLSHLYHLRQQKHRAPLFSFAQEVRVPTYLLQEFVRTSGHYGSRETARRMSLLAELSEHRHRSSVLTVLCSRW